VFVMKDTFGTSSAYPAKSARLCAEEIFTVHEISRTQAEIV